MHIKATKIAEELQSHEKEYVATIEFGATTPSFDLEQEIDNYYPFEHITKEKVAEALKDFIGEQLQVPPLFSAKIIDGLRAYEYARHKSREVKLRKSLINITEIELLSFREASVGDSKLEENEEESIRESSPGGNISIIIQVKRVTGAVQALQSECVAAKDLYAFPRP